MMIEIIDATTTEIEGEIDTMTVIGMYVIHCNVETGKMSTVAMSQRGLGGRDNRPIVVPKYV